MRGKHGHPVHRWKLLGAQVERHTIRCGRDGDALRFRLIERRERAAAGVAAQHDPLVAALPQEPNAGSKILDRALHDQR